MTDYGNPFSEMEAMRPPPKKPPPPKPVRVAPSSAEMKRRRRRGRNGETQVVHLWKKNGWPQAYRTPGSGAWRPYGARDVSPMPFDVASGWPKDWPEDQRQPIGGPWAVEVKFDERMLKTGRGWVGESFVRQTLKNVNSTMKQHRHIAGAFQFQPVLFARGGHADWRIFIESSLFAVVYKLTLDTSDDEWIEVSELEFFGTIAEGVV